jgi:RNA polymerase sigma factor (TIGR02999 family)
MKKSCQAASPTNLNLNKNTDLQQLLASAGPLRPVPPTVTLTDMPDITQLLDAAAEGDPHAAAELLPLVYDELRRLAAARLAREDPGQTLDATALVHEAYLRLVGQGQERSYRDRGHFFAAAARAMRRILVDNARRKHNRKHGGGLHRRPLVEGPAPEPDEELLALDVALDRLAVLDPLKARLVELRYFAGLSGDQAAAALGISPSTADRHWAYARAWLQAEVRGR